MCSVCLCVFVCVCVCVVCSVCQHHIFIIQVSSPSEDVTDIEDPKAYRLIT